MLSLCVLTGLLGRIVNGVFNINYTNIGVLRFTVFSSNPFTNNKSWSSKAQWLTNPTRNHDIAGSIPGLT